MSAPRPELYESIAAIDFAAWRAAGIELVCLDVDSTLTNFNGREITADALAAIARGRQTGLRFVFVTNNIFPGRLRRMQAQTSGAIELIIRQKFFFDRKPSSLLFLRALQMADVSADHAAMIGDSYRNDIVPALRLGFAKAAWVKGYRKSLWMRFWAGPGERQIWQKLSREQQSS